MLSGCDAAETNQQEDEFSHVSELTNLLIGEYDSFRQWQTDLETKVPNENRHGWINRSFIKVAAPKLAENVLVGSTIYSGPTGSIDKNEFLVWTFQTADDGSIIMSPRRFKDLETRLAHLRDAKELSGFDATALEPAISGAACDIRWTKSNDGFLGETLPCRVMSVTKNKMLDWHWQYSLDQDGVWIEFSGTDDNGVALDATPPGKPYRLDRVDESAYAEFGKKLLFSPRKRSDYDASIALLEKAVDQNQQDNSIKIALSYAYLKKNLYPQALEQLSLISESKKDSGTQLSQIDQLWANALQARLNDNYQQEIEAWNALLSITPHARWAWYEIASLHYRSEQYKQSAAAIEKALEIEPEENLWGASYIYYLHSKSLYRLGNYAAAITAAEPGIRNKDTQRATYYRKIIAQIAAGEINDPSEALATYRKMSEQDGKTDEAVLQTNIALLFLELGDYETSVKRARIAYKISQDSYQTWALAYALTEQGKPGEGLELLTKAADIFPENASIRAGKAWAHYRLNQLEQSFSDLKHAQQLSSRKHSGIERDIKIVEAAIAKPNAKQAPAMRWFGD